MYHSNLEIREGAFFITDAHFSSERPELLAFLKDIYANKFQPTQIIFMGDIVDALFGGIEKTIQKNKQIIDLINEISQKVEVVYLEGNHDFNLKKVFPSVKIFPISQQPLTCKHKEKKIILAHGDFDVGFLYRLYTALIRNPLMLRFLALFDTYILNKLDEHLGKKDDCQQFDWFDALIQKRIKDNYDCDYFIEGHFHQNKAIDLININYINLGAFACNQRYFIVKSSQEKEFLEENTFLQER